LVEFDDFFENILIVFHSLNQSCQEYVIKAVFNILK
jgi:hypothetical protein